MPPIERGYFDANLIDFQQLWKCTDTKQTAQESKQEEDSKTFQSVKSLDQNLKKNTVKFEMKMAFENGRFDAVQSTLAKCGHLKNHSNYQIQIKQNISIRGGTRQYGRTLDANN